MNIKRKYARTHLTGKGEILSERPGHKIQFSIINISAGGIKISTDKTLDLNSTVNMRLNLYCGIHSRYVNLKGKVIRAENGLKNMYGIEFIKLTSFQRIELDEILIKYGYMYSDEPYVINTVYNN